MQATTTCRFPVLLFVAVLFSIPPCASVDPPSIVHSSEGVRVYETFLIFGGMRLTLIVDNLIKGETRNTGKETIIVKQGDKK
ncbi:MAG: hypothetical protein GXP25_09655 [Planctomycetes bacterium]|nr:hypothetical protein [Planctomycetota bacterium]